jgi:hypothetical protein
MQYALESTFPFRWGNSSCETFVAWRFVGRPTAVKRIGVATRDERLRENQRAFRTGNERLNAAVDAGEKTIPFLCECIDDTCTDRVELSGQTYSDLHSDESVFVIMSGHPTIEGEVVIEDNGHYHVVKK